MEQHFGTPTRVETAASALYMAAIFAASSELPYQGVVHAGPDMVPMSWYGFTVRMYPEHSELLKARKMDYRVARRPQRGGLVPSDGWVLDL